MNEHERRFGGVPVVSPTATCKRSDEAELPRSQKPWESFVHLGPLRYGAFAGLMLWVALLWGVFIYKVATGPFNAYIMYLTNWSWSLKIVYYTLDALSHADASGRAHRALVYWLFWFQWAVAWLVFWLVFVMFLFNGDIIEKFADDSGVSIGVAMVCDRVVHAIPPLVDVFYMWHRWYLVAHSVRLLRHSARNSRAVSVISALFDIYVKPLWLCMCYMIAYDPRVVYELETVALWAGLPVALVTLTLFVGIPYVVASRHIYHGYHNDELLYAQLANIPPRYYVAMLRMMGSPTSADSIASGDNRW